MTNFIRNLANGITMKRLFLLASERRKDLVLPSSQPQAQDVDDSPLDTCLPCLPSGQPAPADGDWGQLAMELFGLSKTAPMEPHDDFEEEYHDHVSEIDPQDVLRFSQVPMDLRTPSQGEFPETEIEERPKPEESIEEAESKIIHITEGPEKILLITCEDGSQKAGLLLTQQLLHQVSRSIWLDGKLESLRPKMQSASKAMEDLEKAMGNISVGLTTENQEDDRTKSIEILSRKQKNLAERVKRWKNLKRDWQEELDMRRRDVEEVWKGLLESQDLLQAYEDSDETDTASEITSTDHLETTSQGVSEEYSPTPESELEDQRTEHERARDNAMLEFSEKEDRFGHMQHKFDRFDDYYDLELKRWEDAVAHRDCKVPRSEFDRVMLRGQQAITRELIEAERDYREAKTKAAELGILPEGAEQRSQFVDDIDDGYRISSENDELLMADHSRIHKWLKGEREISKNVEVEVDEWNAKEVELSDSISMVAENEERRWIDHWRLVCEATRVKSVN